MDWAGLIESLGSIPTASALKVHLEAAWRESDLQKAQIAKLEKENLELLKENHELHRRLDALNAKPKYFDGGACVFSILDDGEVSLTPLCKNCKVPVGNTHKHTIMVCGKCDSVINRPDVQKSINLARVRNQKKL